MACYNKPTLFLLVPAPEGGGTSYDSIKKLYPPGRQSFLSGKKRFDSGIDLPTPQDVTIPAGEVVLVDLQVKAVNLIRWMKAVNLYLHNPPHFGEGPRQVLSLEPHPLPCAYRLLPRSSISKTPLMMANSEGIIDQGYRGSLKAAVRNLGNEPFTIRAGQALFQIVDILLSSPDYEVLEETDPRIEQYFSVGATERGVGGFGSTGAAGNAIRIGGVRRQRRDNN